MVVINALNLDVVLSVGVKELKWRVLTSIRPDRDASRKKLSQGSTIRKPLRAWR
jgi:hypothetical protein